MTHNYAYAYQKFYSSSFFFEYISKVGSILCFVCGLAALELHLLFFATHYAEDRLDNEHELSFIEQTFRYQKISFFFLCVYVHQKQYFVTVNL